MSRDRGERFHSGPKGGRPAQFFRVSDKLRLKFQQPEHVTPEQQTRGAIMAQAWKAHPLSRSRGNELRVTGRQLVVRAEGTETTYDIAATSGVNRAKRQLFITFKVAPTLAISWLPRRRARQALKALEAARHAVWVEDDLYPAALLAAERAIEWVGRRDALDSRRRWISRSDLSTLRESLPDTSAWEEAATEPTLSALVSARPIAESAAILACGANLDQWATERNERFLTDETAELSHFFATVEKSPLTPQQTRATVCFDDGVRVVAAAGSGKTSTMIARAGYAIRRDIAEPQQILALVFNKDAQKELQERFTARLGEPGSQIASKTFHSFGLSVIGAATGSTPSTPPGLVRDNGVRFMSDVVATLSSEDLNFARDWNEFTVLWGQPDEAPQKDDSRDKFQTLDNKYVNSGQEVLICNWLYLHGIRYEYERPYSHNTATATHRQYRPDFYLPDVDVWFEHFALDRHGNAPKHFRPGYVEGVAWKRALHAEHGTTLFETTSAQFTDGTWADHLHTSLRSYGLKPNFNANRPILGSAPLTNQQLLDLTRTFMTHAKGNRLSIQALKRRDDESLRVQKFLSLYGRILTAWDAKLASMGCVDFEDMLLQAADHIAANRWRSPYKVVMVDELQDTSAARAAIIRALTHQSPTYLYGVGDDWQSINRFAGSDIGVMTDFDKWFGPASTVFLDRTFRSPQSVCSVAGNFVMKNPAQIEKTVVSHAPEPETPIQVVAVATAHQYDAALSEHLRVLNDEAKASAGTGKRIRKSTVLVLGRYRALEGKLSKSLSTRFSHIEVRFSTVHASKGGEADHVVVVGLEHGGFPSKKSDDSLIALAMVKPDPYEYADERRLFYVALTRTRQTVLLLTVDGRESKFLDDLAEAGPLPTTTPSSVTSPTPASSGNQAPATTENLCPKCGTRRLVLRNGPYGRFWGCSGFPKCRGKRRHEP